MVWYDDLITVKTTLIIIMLTITYKERRPVLLRLRLYTLIVF